MDIERSGRIFTVILFLVLAVILGRLILLQVIEGAKYGELAYENAKKVILLPAPRGVIYDRSGQVLASSQPVLSVGILPGRTTDLAATAKFLSGVLGMSAADILRRLTPYRQHPFEPLILRDQVPLREVSRLEEARSLYPGIFTVVKPIRHYPQGAFASHVLGYVGEVTRRELVKNRFRMGDIVGKEGIEAAYDEVLRGRSGGENLEVDAAGRAVRLIGFSEPEAGEDIVLTLDLPLQKAVEGFLGYRPGAVVVLDPRNGEVLALASHPDFDPNMFTRPIPQWEWQWQAGRGYPFLNRALSVYPPGSIFKPITMIAALENRLTYRGEIFNCRGYYELGGRVFRCWKTTGHGRLSLFEGLVWSCGTVFYELGRRAGLALMGDWARQFGFGRPTGIDLRGEAAGRIPDAAWKERVYDEPWYTGDSVNLGIGQGYLQVSPLQMAVLYAALANGGRVVRPHLVKERQGVTVEAVVGEPLPVSSETLSTVREALGEVVRRGTGVAASVRGFPAAGKTGTAEDPPRRPHAWFVGYAPYDNPQIVVATFVEQGEHGDRVAAAITGRIFTWWRDHHLYAQR